MPNPPAARSHEPAPMPAGAADPLPWAPQGPACHPAPRLISRPQINPASEIRPARSPAWAGSLVPRFTTAKPASPWHSQARVWLCLSPKPSSQHRLLGRASTSTTAAEPRPFSSLRFAFQDKKKKQSNCLRPWEVSSYRKAVPKRGMTTNGIRCQGGLFLWKNQISLGES